MKCYKLHLIRHGQTEGNLNGKYVGSTDLPVTDNGIKKLKELQKSGLYPDINLLYCSPMIRTMQSAHVIYPDKNIIIVDDLKEYSFGDFEGKTVQELNSFPEYSEWLKGSITCPPNGEDVIDFTKRVINAITQIIHHLSRSGESEASVILHGCVIMTFLFRCALPRRNLIDWLCGNGYGYTIKITPSLFAKSGIVEVISEIKPSKGEVNV